MAPPSGRGHLYAVQDILTSREKHFLVAESFSRLVAMIILLPKASHTSQEGISSR